MSIDTVGPFNQGIGSASTGGFAGIFDAILQDAAQRAYMETEGMYTATEEAFEATQRDLRDIQFTVPQDQQADALADYLRKSGYSSHVVEQTLGIPREEVDAALMAAGYDVTGQPLPEGTLDNELIKTTEVFDDSTQVINMGSVYLGGGRFRDRETGEITYQEGAALNPAYKVGEIYGYEGPIEMKGEAEDDTFGDLISSIFTQSADTVALGKARAKEIEDENKRIAEVAKAREEAAEQAKTGDTTTITETGAESTTTTTTGTNTGTTTGTGTGDETGTGTGTVIDDTPRTIFQVGPQGPQGERGEPGKSGLIMMLAQQAPITEQMFSRELFEPKFRELDNVAQALGMIQSIGGQYTPMQTATRRQPSVLELLQTGPVRR